MRGRRETDGAAEATGSRTLFLLHLIEDLASRLSQTLLELPSFRAYCLFTALASSSDAIFTVELGRDPSISRLGQVRHSSLTSNQQSLIRHACYGFVIAVLRRYGQQWDLKERTQNIQDHEKNDNRDEGNSTHDTCDSPEHALYLTTSGVPVRPPERMTWRLAAIAILIPDIANILPVEAGRQGSGNICVEVTSLVTCGRVATVT